MKILLYGLNFYPELTGIGKYSGELVEWLSKHEHSVRVITAPPYYPEWKVHTGYSSYKYKTEEYNGAKIYRCPLYVPGKLSTFKRIFHLISFAISSFFVLFKFRKWKPDCIICVAPTLFCVPGANFLKNTNGAVTILHIHDYEVDAMLGLGLAGQGMLAKIARSFEKKCLSSVDYVSTISRVMMKKAEEKGVHSEQLLFLPNWSETQRFINIPSSEIELLKKEFNLSDDYKIILYSGNIGEKQGLEILIDTALHFSNKNYIFLVVGQGGGKEKLEQLVIKNRLTNVSFKPLVSYERLPALLKLADVHLVIQKKGAADAVLPSKLTNILAVGGNAVITAEPGTELGQLCQNFPGIAVLISPESSSALIEGITEALNLPKLNIIGQEYARKYLDKENIIEEFISRIENLIVEKRVTLNNS